MLAPVHRANSATSRYRLAMNRRLPLLALFLLAVATGGRAHTISDIGYQPTANPQVAFDRAVTDARASHRRVLVVAGGDWCRWCHVLDRFLARNADVNGELLKSFVVVKVYVGEDTDNAAFFAHLPEADGYPHFWVFGDDGKLVRSVSTASLESGPVNYDRARFLNFISEYAPK